MDGRKFISAAINAVVMYFNRGIAESEPDKVIDPSQVYVVWCCKTLNNNKGLFSTTVPDGMYYEVTYNGDTEEMYLDAYKKWENLVIVRAKKED